MTEIQYKDHLSSPPRTSYVKNYGGFIPLRQVGELVIGRSVNYSHDGSFDKSVDLCKPFNNNARFIINPIPGYQGQSMKWKQAPLGLPNEKYNKEIKIIPGYQGYLNKKHQEQVDKTPINKYYDNPIRLNEKPMARSGVYIPHAQRYIPDKVGGFRDIQDSDRQH